MKKICLFLVAVFLTIGIVKSQPISDRAVIPAAITLNQILRLNITDGSNIEFVFNDINDYEVGISSEDPQFQTYFNVSSSTPWAVLMYAEENQMTGTDDPSQSISLDNFGFVISASGTHTFNNQLEVSNGASSGG